MSQENSKLQKTSRLENPTVKGIAALLSLLLYTWIWNWYFAVFFMLSMFIHELGHLWAAKKLGMKTGGAIFIPGLGIVALIKEPFPTFKAEVIVAIMGPIWGLVSACAVFLFYKITDLKMAGTLALWITLLNLFNLVPINPMDGGRIIKSIANTVSWWLAKVFQLLGIAGIVFLSIKISPLFLLLLLGEINGLFIAILRELDRRRIVACLARSYKTSKNVDVIIWAIQKSVAHGRGLDKKDRAKDKLHFFTSYEYSLENGGFEEIARQMRENTVTAEKVTFIIAIWSAGNGIKIYKIPLLGVVCVTRVEELNPGLSSSSMNESPLAHYLRRETGQEKMRWRDAGVAFAGYLLLAANLGALFYLLH